LLFQNVRIFVGDGNVIPNGAVLIKGGKIAEVFQNPPADTASLHAEVRDEIGRTVMPGLIDMHVHIGAPGGVYQDPKRYAAPNADAQRLAAYLYCGITAVRSTGDFLNNSLALRSRMRTGDFLGAEFFTYGPVFTAPGGHPTELIESFPAAMRPGVEKEFVRLPKTPAEATQQVDQLKKAGVDGIKAVLESGDRRWHLFNRLDIQIYRAVINRAAAVGLPSATHTGAAADVKDAVEAGTNSIEHGSRVDEIPEALFAAMQSRDIAYDPTLSVLEAFLDQSDGNSEPLERSLVRRVAPPDLISSTSAWLAQQKRDSHDGMFERALTFGNSNLLKAYHAGVLLITGSDAGNMLVIHGPTVQHEMELWVKAGVPAGIALRAATFNAAKVLRADNRIGLIAPQHDATLLLLDGDPVQDITATERIAGVFFKGEEVSRSELLTQDKE
jgi:imidazolonepropionase-like amidohydrolase